MSHDPFSLVRQLDSVCHQQARCHVNLPMIKKAKIPPTAPAPEPRVDQVCFPAPFSILPCHCRDRGKHYLCSRSLNQSPQCPEVPFDRCRTSLCNLITASLYNQQRVVIRRPYQTRELPSDVSDPGPREAADFPVGRVRSAYRALCSPQKGIAYDNYPPFFLSSGSRNAWG